MAPRRDLRRHDGFTLVEVLVAALVLVVGVLGVLGLVTQANRVTSRTKAREAAVNLGRELVEAARAVPYGDLVPTRVQGQIAAQPGLADETAGAPWEVRRRGVTYTLTATACAIDDPGDGLGDHTGVPFCADSAATGTNDASPDDYKRVSVDVSWRDAAETRVVTQTAVINNGGSAFAPAVITLPSSPASPVLGGTSVSFTATTTRAEELRWYVDGIERGVVAGPGTSFSFSWSLAGVVDGVYLVSASAFDRYGESGAGRTATMVVNRAAPAKPAGVVGGRNGLWGANVVDLRWNPNPERDITAYKVFRQAGSTPADTDPIVCETTPDDRSPYACTDDKAPAGSVRYYVRAFAPARPPATGTEPSALPGSAEALQVNEANKRPGAPLTVQLYYGADGAATLTWTPAADLDGTISGYRIYRDDNGSWQKRYDAAGAGELSWKDRPGSGAHRYWITAIDDKLAESDFAPPGGVGP